MSFLQPGNCCEHSRLMNKYKLPAQRPAAGKQEQEKMGQINLYEQTARANDAREEKIKINPST